MTRQLGLAFLACIASLAGVRDANAGAYYWTPADGAVATYVYRIQGCYAASSVVMFETNNLDAGADTVLHLWDGTNEVGYNDDVSGSPRSLITYFVPAGPSCKTITAIVRAKSNATGGTGGKTFNFYINGVMQGGKHRLGGYQITTTHVGAGDTFETVSVNNGAGATMLMRLQYNSSLSRYELKAIDTSFAGVGNNAKLTGTPGLTSQLWVIGTPTSPTREGPVKAVRNNPSGTDDLPPEN